MSTHTLTKFEFLNKLKEAVDGYGHICSAMGDAAKSWEGKYQAAASAAHMVDFPATSDVGNHMAHAIIAIDHCLCNPSKVIDIMIWSENAWEYVQGHKVSS